MGVGVALETQGPRSHHVPRFQTCEIQGKYITKKPTDRRAHCEGKTQNKHMWKCEYEYPSEAPACSLLTMEQRKQEI